MTNSVADHVAGPTMVMGAGGLAGFRMSIAGPETAVELPHPGVTVLFQLGDPVVIGEGDRASGQRAVLVGLTDRPTTTVSSGLVDCIEIRLSPAAAFGLVRGASLGAGNDPVDLGAVLGTRVDEVVERVASATSWTDRFAIVRTLVDHADSAVFGDAEVEHAWRLLSESRGTVSVKQLCDATGWSANRLRRRFERQVGMSPKREARLIRFDCARRLLVAGMSSADTAAHAGFADQSHLHREVRAFADLTPAELTRIPA